MLFTSVEFVVLYLATFVGFHALPSGGAQVLLLIGASFVFYAWNVPALLALLLLSILTNAVVSFRVAKSRDAGAMRAWAVGGVVFNLLLLGLFKYDVLIMDLARRLIGAGNASSGVAALAALPLPIGISFYTFEGISLVVDVFRGRDPDNAKPVTSYVVREGRFLDHLRDTALFIAFFPHLIAGPVLKAQSFFPQIGRRCGPGTFGRRRQLAHRKYSLGDGRAGRSEPRHVGRQRQDGPGGDPGFPSAQPRGRGRDKRSDSARERRRSPRFGIQSLEQGTASGAADVQDGVQTDRRRDPGRRGRDASRPRRVHRRVAARSANSRHRGRGGEAVV
ncbi:MAG: hypothetical protein WDN01_08380 [Rhizomicrobium sp.]